MEKYIRVLRAGLEAATL